VLIVEDDPCVGPELAAELEIRGYAVEWVRDAHAGSPPIAGKLPCDVVVLDYFLPRGDGLSLTRAWKTHSHPPAVVLVSGADVTAEIQRRLPPECRPDRTFAKPLGLSTFVAEIARLAPIDRRDTEEKSQRARGRRTPIESRPPTLADILWRLYRAQRTGVLELPGPEGLSIVHVLNGAPVFVESGTLNDTLGRVMLREGILRGNEYERVLRRMTDDLVAGEDVRFGEVAVEMGYATAEQVVDALRAQVREKLVNLFHLDPVQATFREGRERIVGGSIFRVDPGEVILEGIRRHGSPQRLEPLVERYQDEYAAPSPAFDESRGRLRFTAREQRFLAQIRGDRTIRALVGGGTLDRVHALQVIYALLTVDALELTKDPVVAAVEARPPSGRARTSPATKVDPAREDVLSRHLRLSGRTHYEVLGVDPRAPQGEIERAYQTLSARYSPDRLVTMGLGDVHEQATEMWARITIAYETLRDPIRRDAYDQTLPSKGPPTSRTSRQAALQAESAFQAGLRELAADRTAQAVAELQRAARLVPGEPEYACYEIWASCLRAIGGGAEPRETARRARSRIEAAMVDRRPRARTHYVLALVCQMIGDLDAARAHVHACLAFDPTFAEARRLSEALAPATPPGGDVLLG
jgi:CheY-like chemotaxis protein/DnaJ-domain-containing protein 1